MNHHALGAEVVAHTGPVPASWPTVAAATGLVLVAAAHAARTRRGRDRSSVQGRAGRLRWRAGAFVVGWFALAVALVSPLEAAATDRFAWHMVQHLLLTTIAAPLLAVGDAGRAVRTCLPYRVRVAWAAAARRLVGLTRPVLALPLAGLVATATFLVWHAPGLYDLAVGNGAVHLAEHTTMFGSAYLLWRAVVTAARRGAELAAAATVAVVTLPEIALGALLAVSPRAWYGAYELAPAAALADQQLGGLLMWVPTGVVHLGVALALGFRALSPAAGATVEPGAAPPRLFAHRRAG